MDNDSTPILMTTTTNTTSSAPIGAGSSGLALACDDVEAAMSAELLRTYQPLWARLPRASQSDVFRRAQKLLKQLYDDTVRRREM
jgi:hypothetical protein